MSVKKPELWIFRCVVIVPIYWTNKSLLNHYMNLFGSIGKCWTQKLFWLFTRSRVVTWQRFCMILILIQDNGKMLSWNRFLWTNCLIFRDISGTLYQVVWKGRFMKGRIIIILSKSVEYVQNSKTWTYVCLINIQILTKYYKSVRKVSVFKIFHLIQISSYNDLKT